MSRRLCRFTFSEGIGKDVVERAVADALFVAECLHGSTKVRLAASYYLAPKPVQCVVDTTSEIGEQVAQVLTGFMAREHGEEAFRVERLGTSDSEAANA